MNKEVWLDIPKCKGYQVSNFGRVKGQKKILSGSQHNNGYLYVTILGRQHTIHRLVAQLFIQNELSKPYINHKDGNKLNNNVNNLEWCTAKENMQHAFKNKLVRTNTKKKKNSELENIKKAIISNLKKVSMYDKNRNYIKDFNSIVEAARSLNINASHITQCCKHNQKTCGGYIWEYANDRQTGI